MDDLSAYLLTSVPHPQPPLFLFDTAGRTVIQSRTIEQDPTPPGSDDIPLRKYPKHDSEVYYMRERCASYPRQPHSPPVPTGFVNINNTCYMNSVLQCLFSLERFSRYFRSNAWAYHKNVTNRLGSKGEVLTEVARIRHELESNKYSAYAPVFFKTCLASHNSQYTMAQQNDAHEFLLYVLDKVHEDTNLVLNKPLVEYKELDPTLPDSECATLTYHLHRLRDQSYLNEIFLGMTKSTLWCPLCQHVAVQFDVSKVVSIPVQNPLSQYLLGGIPYIPKNATQARQFLYVRIKRAGNTIGTLRRYLCRLLHHANGDHLVIACVDKQTRAFKRVYRDDEELKEDVIKIPGVKEVPVIYDMLYSTTEAPFLVVEHANGVFPTAQKNAMKKINPELTVQSAESVTKKPFSVLPDEVLNAILTYWNKTLDDHVVLAHAYNMAKVRQSFADKYLPGWESSLSPSPDYPILIPLQGTTTFNDVTELRRAIEFVYPMSGEDAYELVEHKGDDSTTTTLPVSATTITTSFREGHAILSLRVSWQIKAQQVLFMRHESYQEVADWIARNSKQDATLSDCLKNACSEEEIDESTPFKCDKCQAKVRASKQTQFYETPKYLCLHLKRFAWDMYSGEQVKVRTPVSFPVEKLSLAPYMTPSTRDGPAGKETFSLVGVVVHIGDTFYGHYYAYVKKKGVWYLCDDDCVKEVKPEDVVDQNAYLLFYEKDECVVEVSTGGS